MKWTAVLVVWTVLALVCLLGGRLYIAGAAKNMQEAEMYLPERALEELLDELNGRDTASLYARTQAVYPSLDTEEAYGAFLNGLLETYGDDLHTVETDEGYRLYAGDTYLADMELIQDEEGLLHAVMPLEGECTAVVEVPAGEKVSVNGRDLSQYRTEENVPAANCLNMGSAQPVYTDVYELEGLLAEPGLDGYALIQDVRSGHWLAGREVTDPELLQEMIDDAETIAAFPAQDGTLAQAAAVSVTDSAWYRRYATVQNYWFTSHSVSEFSNGEVLKAVYQDDRTIAAHVVFDYYADNGEVHRTWHCGYQMTFRLTDQGWKVANMAIANELNPGTVLPE